MPKEAQMSDTPTRYAALQQQLHDAQSTILNLEENAARIESKGLLMSSVFDAIDEVVYVSDPDTYEVLFTNKKAQDTFGDILGKKCYETMQQRDSPCLFCTNSIIFGDYHGRSYVWEFENKTVGRWFRCVDKAIPWPTGKEVRYEMAIDVSELKQAEQMIAAQAQEIMELSTPVIKVWEGILIAPLIGMMDSQRTQMFMERFLGEIVATNSSIALVDITGVPTVDTQTAQHLIEAISAARLLGTRVILTGMRPVIAQTIVHLGIDLSDILTLSSLSTGIREAFKLLNIHITSSQANPDGE